MKNIYVDTNVLLRYFVGDIPEQTDRTKHVFKSAEKGHIRLYMSLLVLHEFDYTMRHFYKTPRNKFIVSLQMLISTTHMFSVETSQKALHHLLDILLEYPTIDVTDIYLAQQIKSHNDGIVSFDKDFEKLTDQIWSFD